MVVWSNGGFNGLTMRQIGVIFFILLYFVIILIDGYIFLDVRTYCTKHKRAWLIIHGIFLVISLALLTVIACWPIRSGGKDILPVMWIIYAFLTILIPKISYVVCSVVGRLFKISRNGRKINYGVSIGVVIAVIIFILMWWGALFTRNRINVEEVTVSSPRVPKAFNGYRIVQLSDLHVGTWGNDTRFISKLVNRVNSMNPDLIVFTGDVVNRETSEMEPFLSIFSKLKAKDGVYSVLGNHDYGDYMDWEFSSQRDSNNMLMSVWQNQIGWKLMNNRRDFITHGGDSIVILGVENWGEPPFRQYGKLTEAYPLSRDSVYNLNDSRFKILLSHNPEHWNREVTNISNIDLTLSGHTHAMQMVFNIFGYEWSPSEWKYPQWKGLYERKNPNGEMTRVYVNIGAGEVGIPSRFGSAYPEITEITLRHSKE